MKSIHIKGLLLLFLNVLINSSKACESDDNNNQKIQKIRAASLTEYYFFNIPNDIKKEIFLNLNLPDLSAVSRVDREWSAIVQGDNHFWYSYAARASLFGKSSYREELSYKDLIKKHCTYSFRDFGEDKKLMSINNYDEIAGVCNDTLAIKPSQAFKLVNDEQIIWLNTLKSYKYSDAAAVNADGKVVVGSMGDESEDSNFAFIWTKTEEIQSLGTLNDEEMSSAEAVSADGKVVVGRFMDRTVDYRERAFIWTRAKGMRSLGTLNRGMSSYARAVSADGKVVVGWSEDGTADNRARAFIWTEAEGMQPLGTLNGGKESRALAVSADGKVVVGWSEDGTADNRARAFIWTEAQGMQPLGTLNGGKTSCAQAVSVDGKVVVVESDDGTEDGRERAFIWTEKDGMQSIEALLESHGVLSTREYKLTSVTAVSPSGTLIVGHGLSRKDNRIIYWKASIPRRDLF